MYGESIIRRRKRQVGTDRYGSPVFAWVDTELPGSGFDPGGSREILEVGREPVITEPKLFFYESAPDIQRQDRVIVRDVEYEVTSDPADWVSPFTGWRAGLVVELTRTGG